METAGSIDNLSRLIADQHALAAVFMGSAFDAYTGSGSVGNETSFKQLNALFPMYETSFQLVALRTRGIVSVRGLAGRRVGVGPEGGPAAIYFKGLAEAVDLSVETVTGTPSELVDAMVDGRVDALWQGAPAPIPAIVDVQKRVQAIVIGLTTEEQTAMRMRFPYLSATVVAPGTYQGQLEPLRSVGAWNFVVVNSGFPDDDAYRVTRAVLSSGDPANDIGASARSTQAEHAVANTFLPFHPGALLYYRERGIRGLR